jgi:protein TonB
MSQAQRIPLTTGVQHVFLPALITFLIFMALPLANVFQRPAGNYVLHELADTVATLSAPPERQTVPSAAVPDPIVVPHLASEPMLLPVQASLKLETGAPDLSGAFLQDFRVADIGLNADMQSMVFEIADVDAEPFPVRSANPIYPFRAKQRQIEGFVSLSFIVDADGMVRDVAITDSDPKSVFDQSALKAVGQWRFKPGSKDGTAVRVRIHQTIRFTLDP